MNEEDRLVENDQRIVQAAKSIKILSHLGWPDDACPEFLEKWNRSV